MELAYLLGHMLVVVQIFWGWIASSFSTLPHYAIKIWKPGEEEQEESEVGGLKVEESSVVVVVDFEES